MKTIFKVNGVAFCDSMLAWNYISTYLMNDQITNCPKIEEENGEKVYFSLEEYEKDNPQACIQRLRTERFLFREQNSKTLNLPFVLQYNVEGDIRKLLTNRLTIDEGYQLSQCAEMELKSQDIDRANKNFEFVVTPRQPLEHQRKFKMTVGQSETLKEIVDKQLTKVAEINRKIKAAMKKYGINDEQLQKENEQYQEFQEQYVQKVKEMFKLKQYGSEEEVINAYSDDAFGKDL